MKEEGSSMTKRIVEISQRETALVAGYGILLMTLFYLYAEFFVFKTLIVPGDAITTT
jgi:hypothetical protein